MRPYDVVRLLDAYFVHASVTYIAKHFRRPAPDHIDNPQDKRLKQVDTR